MTGSIKTKTPKFKFIIPQFNIATWHDFIEDNFRAIDALFFNIFDIQNFNGSWTKTTEYKKDQVLFIGEDYEVDETGQLKKDDQGELITSEFSGRMVKVLKDHTTDNSDYFSLYYFNHKDEYELFADASTAQKFANLAKQYSENAQQSENNAELYKNNAQGYAQEAENSKNIAQQNAQLATNKAESAASSATVAKNSENSAANSATLAEGYKNDAKRSADSAKSSEDATIENVQTVTSLVQDPNLVTVGTDLRSASSNIKNVSSISEQTKSVSDNMSAVVDVSNNKTNINNVSVNIAAVNNVSENMADVKKAVQSANDAKLWAVGTIAEKPEGSSKYWAEEAKNAAQTPDASETVKGIVRLATNDEVTAGTNDSAAITPLKLKQTIAQDLTNPSTNTVPSTKAVSDESSRLTSIMNNKVNKSGDTMTGNLIINGNIPAYILQDSTLDLSQTFTDNRNDSFFLERDKNGKDGSFITFRHDVYDANVTEVCASNGVDTNRKIQSMGIWVKKNGECGTYAPKCSLDNSILITVSSGTDYVRLGNGLIIQWVYFYNTGATTWIFPTPFSNTNYAVVSNGSVWWDNDSNKKTTSLTITDTNYGNGVKFNTYCLVAIGR